jgi:ATP-binding protein involved in chromosome partitioning
MAIKHIVAVMSGKGGVGKSTVAVNLAVALAREGLKVGLLDADFYGPSIPTMLGGGQVTADDEKRLVPPEKFGVKYISLGFFLKSADDAVMWRGPMFSKALEQMFSDIDWGDLDCCLVDMPPGTGDAAISLSQIVQLSGALLVTTPQELALADVRKTINMLKTVNVPILGLVENMAGYTTPGGERVDIFGAGGGEKTAKAFELELLASIPLQISIREAGDRGEPAVVRSADAEGAFEVLALKVSEILATKTQPVAPAITG